MNEKVKRKSIVIILIVTLFAIIAPALVSAAPDEVWAQSVVSSDSCWSGPNNILDADNDIHTIGINEYCTIVVDMNKTFSTGTVYLNRHYESCSFEGDVGIRIYVSSDAISWTDAGDEYFNYGSPPPTSDSDFTVTFSQDTRFLKIVKLCIQPVACEVPVYLDSVRINGDLSGPKPDLIPGDIEVKHNYYNGAWANLNNTVDVTVQNNGTADAGLFDVKLYADYEEVDSKIVSELLAGNSTLVSFIWKPTDSEVYDLKVVVDPQNAITESNETNNETTKQQNVGYNGYMGDKPLTTYAHDRIKGNIFFTHGDSYYSSIISPGNTYTVHHTVTIPDGTTVKFARLYSYWTWSPIVASMSLTFDGNPVNSDKEYHDRKGWSPGYNYPAGTYAYNVTGFVDGSGDHTTVITNTGSNYFCMDGVGLLVVYTDPNGTDIEYWINEGADMLSSMGTSRGITPDEATTPAQFSGSIDLDNASSAWLWTVVQSGGHLGNMLIFNDCNWTGVYDGTPYSDLDIDEKRDVISYLDTDDNLAQIRAAPYPYGDYLMPSNAFLVIEYGPDTTPPNVTQHSPTGVDISIQAEILITFSEAMNHTSTQNAFSIVPDTTGTFTWDGNNITFSPDSPDYNTTYSVSIASSATDLSGNTLDGNDNGISEGSPADDYIWQFTTEQQSQPGVCGDVTNDTNVNIGDVILIANHVGYPDDPRYEVDEWAADVNGNGGVNIGDVILLANHVGYPDDPKYMLNCTNRS